MGNKMSDYPRKYERVGDAPYALTVAESDEPTWDGAAHDALSLIFSASNIMGDADLEWLRIALNKFIDQNMLPNKKAPKVPGMSEPTLTAITWANIGAMAIKIAAQREEQFNIREVHQTVVRKQRDYGPENIRRFGRGGLLIRMHDKVARLENLLNLDGGGKPNNESIRDNLMDVVGYSCVAIMWEMETFLLPLRQV